MIWRVFLRESNIKRLKLQIWNYVKKGTKTTTDAPTNDKKEITEQKEVSEISSIKIEDDSETDENKPMEPREAIVRSVPSIELPDGKILQSLNSPEILLFLNSRNCFLSLPTFSVPLQGYLPSKLVLGAIHKALLMGEMVSVVVIILNSGSKQLILLRLRKVPYKFV